MENHRDDIAQLNRDFELEEAYYILLSLCREYSIEMTKGYITKEECFAKLKQIRNDMKQLERQALINKTDTLYQPMLQAMEKKHYDLGRRN